MKAMHCQNRTSSSVTKREMGTIAENRIQKVSVYLQVERVSKQSIEKEIRQRTISSLLLSLFQSFARVSPHSSGLLTSLTE